MRVLARAVIGPDAGTYIFELGWYLVRGKAITPQNFAPQLSVLVSDLSPDVRGSSSACRWGLRADHRGPPPRP